MGKLTKNRAARVFSVCGYRRGFKRGHTVKIVQRDHKRFENVLKTLILFDIKLFSYVVVISDLVQGLKAHIIYPKSTNNSSCDFFSEKLVMTSVDENRNPVLMASQLFQKENPNALSEIN